MQFLNTRDANRRLERAVHFINGEFIYAYHVDSEGNDGQTQSLKYVPLSDLRKANKKVKALKLNDNVIKPIDVELGWVNIMELGTAVYVSRLPVRGSNMGIHSGNLRIQRGTTTIGFNTLIRDPGFEEALKGSYPKITTFAGQQDIFAVSPRVALKKVTMKTYSILYDQKVVGEYTLKSDYIILYPKFEYLKEYIEKVLKGVVHVRKYEESA
tara:strand:- start:5582 stop:6217 length:636 start_codon:yes stop_codon:yes gene_type:complete